MSKRIPPNKKGKMSKRILPKLAHSSSSSIPDPDGLVDDFYFSALLDCDEIFPISDEKYAEELQLQEALFYSSSIFNLSSSSSSSASSSKPISAAASSSSKSKQAFCAICMDAKPTSEMFRGNCSAHTFCTDCMAQYISVKLQENAVTLKCPDSKCSAVLEPQMCRPIVPQAVLSRWEDALCESLILASQKIYCPYNDCSAMMVHDGEYEVTSSECPSCRRLFCASCSVPWHAGVECAEHKRSREDEGRDEEVVKLAEFQKWRRCPNCRFYVERVSGCMHIICRCEFEFCYGCGSKWSGNHACSSMT